MPPPFRRRGVAKVILPTSWSNIWARLANIGKLWYSSSNIYYDENEL